MAKKTKAPNDSEPASNVAGAAPIIIAIIDYERWLHERVKVVEEDLEDKHRQMTGSLFAFLRATFYRWGPLWLEVCSDRGSPAAAGGGRSACGEFRNLARQGGQAGLGRQRFR